jgi:flagellar protein FlaG
MPIDVSTIQAHAGMVAAHTTAQGKPVTRAVQSDVMRTEPPVSMDAILSELSDVGAAFNKRLSFRLNEKLDQVVVKVIDTDTDKVIREIPPAELQHVHERIREVIGILFDERV